MPVIPRIPKVSKCFYCFDLKLGTILIGIYGLVSMGSCYPHNIEDHVYIHQIPTINSFEVEDCKITAVSRVLKTIFMIISAVVHLGVFCASVGLLIGIYYMKPITVVVFIYAVLVSIAVTILQAIFFQFKYHFGSFCGYILPNQLHATCSILLWLYFVAVVNSFYDIMEAESNSDPIDPIDSNPNPKMRDNTVITK